MGHFVIAGIRGSLGVASIVESVVAGDSAAAVATVLASVTESAIAGDLLAAWSAHDALHLRQISKRLYQIAQRDAGSYSVQYAGEWRAVAD